MNMNKLVAVSSVSGVMRLVSTKDSGLFLEDFDTKKIRFFSSRKYNFTPLESISIYVDSEEETLPLGNVFANMKEQLEANPVVSTKADSEEIKAYFEKVLPSYNREQVYVSDIKKLIKWFDYLNERDLLQPKTEEEIAAEAAALDVEVDTEEV
ncbi:MAG: hypothetical protein HC803_05185 [Saprospiraceae bacterium]|nr:hypothetical protein [Saprospiraceae bacterium]